MYVLASKDRCMFRINQIKETLHIEKDMLSYLIIFTCIWSEIVKAIMGDQKYYQKADRN